MNYKKNVLKPIKVLLLFSTILLCNFIFAQQKNDISKNETSIEKKSQTTFLEEQLKTFGAEKINSLIKNRKVSVENVFNKIKAYKTTSDAKVKTDLLLDLCTLSNPELNILLSKFGEKNEENAKLDVAFANYFKRADALVGQNVFIAGLDKSKSEKLNALNKTILKGDYKRPELIIFGIAEVICIGAPCCKCGGSGCNPCFSSGIDAPENLSKPKCPPGYSLMPNGDCAPNEELPSDYPKDHPIKKQAFGTFSVEGGYIFSVNSENKKENQLLFAGNGFTGGVAYRYGGVIGGVIKTKYTFGSIDNNSIEKFAKTFEENGLTTKITTTNRNWNQIIVAGGPSILFAKFKGEINFVGGVSFGSKNTVNIDRYDANTFVNNAFTATQKSTMFYWDISSSYRITKFKKGLFINLVASYGSNGGTIGLALVTNDCRGIKDCHRLCMCGGHSPTSDCCPKESETKGKK